MLFTSGIAESGAAPIPPQGVRLLFGLYGYVEDEQPFEGDAQTKRQ